jgi:hypothetical protein
MKFEDIAKKYNNFYPPPSYKITIEGEDILKKYLIEVTNVTFEDALDASDRFSFTINDPTLKWLDSGLFEVGKTVEIKMGYLDKLTTMILGEVITVRPSFQSDSTPEIEISGYDLSHQFTRLCKHKTWKNKRDSEVVEEIVRSDRIKYKLKADIKKTEVVLTEIVQDGETDYTFIRKLADRNFFEFFVRERNLYFGPSKRSEDPITLEYRKSLLRFSPELNIANQVSEVIVRGWNPKTKQEIVGKASSVEQKEGKAGGDIMKKLYGKVEHIVTDRPVYSQPEADVIARSMFNRLSVGVVRGSAESIGMPEVKAGDDIVLSGLGQKFSQKYFIERTTHSINSSGYTTTFSVRGDVA